MACTKFAFGILGRQLDLLPLRYYSKRYSKNEAHGPPLFFAVFTRSRTDLNSQWICKKDRYYFTL